MRWFFVRLHARGHDLLLGARRCATAQNRLEIACCPVGVREIAKAYLDVYREIGGRHTGKEMMEDFIIVASASLRGLDVVTSEDKRTMLSNLAIKSYTIVNKLNKLKTPDFIDYEEFKDLLGSSSDKLSDSSPKFWVFHIHFILLPYIFPLFTTMCTTRSVIVWVVRTLAVVLART